MLFPLYAQDEDSQNITELPVNKKYGFSIGTQFGFVYGQAFEYVYPGPEGAKGELLSELIWDMKPIYYYGAEISFSRKNIMSAPGFIASVSFKAGIPGSSGIMEDRDWQSTEKKALTNFSSHTNKTKEFFILDALAGASIPVKSFFYIKPFLNGSWMRFSYEGKDGYYKYARGKGYNSGKYYDIDDKPDIDVFEGIVITYKQDWLLLATGLSIGTEILRPFSFDLSFKASPLTYCASTDEHLLIFNTYKDFTSFGLYMEPALCISYSFEVIKFSLDYSFRYIGRTTGETYYKPENSEKYYLSPNESGAALYMSNTRFLVTVHF